MEGLHRGAGRKIWNWKPRPLINLRPRGNFDSGGCELFLRRKTAWLAAFQESLLTLKTINRHLLFSYDDLQAVFFCYFLKGAGPERAGAGPKRVICAREVNNMPSHPIRMGRWHSYLPHVRILHALAPA